jgi:predicted acyltransferase
MLRRIARVLRQVLFVVGLVAGLLLILSLFVSVRAWSHWPGDQTVILGGGGVIHVAIFWDATGVPLYPERIEITYGVDILSAFLMFLYFPSYDEIPDPTAVAVSITIPLWLLAFLCLAWPVTSFVIARRRRGTRGFEVEPSRGVESDE